MKINRTLLFFTIFIFSTGAVVAADLNITTAEVAYYTNGKDVKGYLARPGDNQKHPGIILIHEWWGLNDNIRENAGHAFANEGGDRYAKEAAELAWSRTVTFLKKTL